MCETERFSWKRRVRAGREALAARLEPRHAASFTKELVSVFPSRPAAGQSSVHLLKGAELGQELAGLQVQ